MDVFEKHQTRIALDTLRMHPAMLGVMGGMTREQAVEYLESRGWIVEGDTARRGTAK